MRAKTVRCQCGVDNPVEYKFCGSCGRPLLVPQSPPETLGPPGDAIEIWERAGAMLGVAAKKVKADEREWVDIASQLSLAIKKSGDIPFPSAHADLAFVWAQLNKSAEAEKEINIALQQNPNEFRAQHVKVVEAGKKLQMLNLGVGDFVHLEQHHGGDTGTQIAGTIIESVLGTIISSFFALASAGATAINHANFRDDVEKLVAIFKNLCSARLDVDEYMYMAETLISLGDTLRETSLIGGYPNLFAAVASTPVDALNQLGRENEVTSVRQLAEGRMALFSK